MTIDDASRWRWPRFRAKRGGVEGALMDVDGLRVRLSSEQESPPEVATGG
jgi:hypothetical protein